MATYLARLFYSHVLGEQPPRSHEHQTALKRSAYKQGWELPWHARSQFFCKGRFFMGPPDYRYLVYAIVLAIVTCMTLVFSVRQYFFPQQPVIKHYQESNLNSGNKPPHLNCISLCDSRLLYFAFLFCSLVALYNFIACSYTDPGVLLRHKDSEKMRQ